MKAALERRNKSWFALADTKQCRLLRCRLTTAETLHVDQYDTLENTFPEHEHLRPMTEGGMTHDVEEKERRFVGEVAAWLQSQVGKHEIDHLIIFASPRVLGILRKTPLGLLKGRVEEVKGNLMRLRAGELAAHPMVGRLLRAACVH